jgi:REP element-mobilizing transposase RayT
VTDIPFPKPHRLPPEWYQQRGNTFHLVARAFLFDAPFKGRLGDAVWQQVVSQPAHRVSLLAACLMPDHLHLIAQVAEEDLLEWLGGFKSFTTNLSWKHGHRGALWQPDSWDRLIREHEFDATFSYVMHNPVAAGLVEDVDDWPWVRSWLDEDAGSAPSLRSGPRLR